MTDLETHHHFPLETVALGMFRRDDDLDDFFLPNSDWVTIHSRAYEFFARDRMGAEMPEPVPPYSTLMLTSMYKWDAPAEVSAFLREHPEAGAILESVYQAILAPFGSVEDLTLQVVRDPSEPDDPELFVLVRTNDDPRAAREKLRHFETEWWDNQSATGRQLIHFDVT